MIFERHANLKYKYGNRDFWCRVYYVDTAGKNAKKIPEYIRNQIQEDLEYDQMSLKEYVDPFTGEPVVMIFDIFLLLPNYLHKRIYKTTKGYIHQKTDSPFFGTDGQGIYIARKCGQMHRIHLNCKRNATL